MYRIRCSSQNNWINDTIYPEYTSNKKSSWSATPNNTNYPTEKLVKDSIDAVDKMFVVTYPSTGVSGTSASDIIAAYNAGKVPVVWVDNTLYILSRFDNNYIYFGGVGTTVLYYVRVKISDSSYTKSLYDAQVKSNLVKSTSGWSQTPSDDKYPSEKLTKESIDAADKVFVATYGSTTYSAITAALSSGKAVFAKLSNGEIAPLSSAINSRYYFGRVFSGILYTSYVGTNDSWNGANVQLTTSWGSTPSDTKYPSEKLVKNTIDALPVIPSGGTAGQVLAKASGTDYDVTWTNKGGGDGATIIINDGSDGDSVAVILTDNQSFKRSFRIDMTAEYTGGNNEQRIGSLIVECYYQGANDFAHGYYYGDDMSGLLTEVAVYNDDYDQDTYYLMLKHNSALDSITFAITPLDGDDANAFVTNAVPDHTKVGDANIEGLALASVIGDIETLLAAI